VSVVYAGVDGGGTRTRVALTDERGRELVRSEGPSSLVDPSHPAASGGVVAGVIRDAAAEAGVPLPLRAVFAAVAGTGREAVRSAVELALEDEGVAERVRVDADVVAAFRDAFHDGPGLLVVSGTGSMGMGRNEKGREARVGGWGSVLGGEGSGFGIGREALRRIARSADRRGPATDLGRAVTEHLGLQGVDDLIRWAHEAEKADMASLVPVVVAQSRGGDAVAGEILVQAVEELEQHVLALLHTLGPWQDHPRIALTGGLLAPSGPLRRGMETVLARHALGRVDREPDAVRGAAELARSLG
jgi:N-acetylglucosamine kinase-like BadF-type ATPase